MTFEMEDFKRADGQVDQEDVDCFLKTDCAVCMELLRLVERTTSVTVKRDEVSDGHVISVTSSNPWAYAQRNSLLEALKDCNTSLDATVHA